VVAGREELIPRVLDAIDRELEGLDRPAVETIFIGGGTPTHLPPDSFSRLLEIVSRRFRLGRPLEWSLEANPEDVTATALDCMTEFGVNRVSLGVQAFDSQKLGVLERGHSGDRAESVVRQIADRIENVAIDLIFAAPGETVDGWRQDLGRALSLPIQHLSTYALTFEKGTSFWSRRRKGQLCSATESTELTMYQVARQLVASRGLTQYEISNFARPGFECRHNIGYWQGRGWFAAGPGAARFVAGKREVNHRSTTTYLRRIESGIDPVAESEAISPTQYARERAAFGVRMMCGIDLAQLTDETGVDAEKLLAAAISKCRTHDLVTVQGGCLRLTERGVTLADTVAAEFLG
jgi:oxygen-independent coproporphyrinogen-3 oxidase